MRIKDVKQFEELICATVDEYLRETECYDQPVLAIWREKGEHHVVIDEPSKLPHRKDMETYPIDEVVRPIPDGYEPESDRISAIANEWVFIEH